MGKKIAAVIKELDQTKQYSLQEAIATIKKVSFTKFDETLEVAINLGVDPRHSDQMVRGIVSLPAGLGKDVKVAVICKDEKIAEAKAAGADFVGLDEFIQKIEGGWVDIDVVVATPSVMPKIGKLGKVLGPRNLMPNPKTGTVTNDVAGAINEVKGGKIAFKVDKTGIVHASIGRVSFTSDKIAANSTELIHAIVKLKPSASKGTYVKGISIATSMSPGITLDTKPLIN